MPLKLPKSNRVALQQVSIYHDSVTILSDRKYEEAGGQISVVMPIHAFDCVVQDIYVQQKVVFHGLGVLQRVEILSQFCDAVFEEARKPSRNPTFVVNLETPGLGNSVPTFEIVDCNTILA